ncbi:hypothetical protein E3E11_03790 [Oecophyllibacter saccharovorans]|uniref:hypothetical protein n=1 Tax=Oecophyllibacter saccharovorans TaxID=2558360 RepID=UPI001143E87C|nr:hypothetical protein [Oecophyllibacter saccharovorans]QDH15125.1 hypothetical protein E3E11_03790 [Oecophyllibacter saccharovorans]
MNGWAIEVKAGTLRRLCGLVFLALMAEPVAHCRAAPPAPTIRSLNLCTDQLVLELLGSPGETGAPQALARAQILGLTPLVQRCTESAFCREAGSNMHAPLPSQLPTPESLILERPDVILDGPWGHEGLERLVRRALSHEGKGNFVFHRLRPPETLEGVADQLERLGETLGVASLARERAQAYRQALGGLIAQPPDKPPHRPLTAVVLEQEPSAFTLALVRQAGFRPVGLSGAPETEAGMEALLRRPPDLLVLPVLGEGASLSEAAPQRLVLLLQGRQGEGHGGVAVLRLPQRLLLCPTTRSLEALRKLIAMRHRLSASPP